MPSIYSIKEQDVVDAPIVLFDCALRDGSIYRWSTHSITHDGQSYTPRVLAHNLFELRYGGDSFSDGSGRLSLTLANADSYFSQIDPVTGWKGAKLSVHFAFYDLATRTPTSEARVFYTGVAAGIDEVTESTFRMSFNNRLAMQRLLLPSVRIQRRCPWIFPSTPDQRQEAVAGGTRESYSAFFHCGYSPGITGGVGNLDGLVPFTSCSYTRSDCQARGMFDTDTVGNITRRFGGMEFLPAYLSDKDSRVTNAGNEAIYNDFVPLVYGTAWYQPPVVLTEQTAQATNMDVLLALGPIQGVLKVLVNKVEIPIFQPDRVMDSTGWYRLGSSGTRNGAFDTSFEGATGVSLGNPYGSMAYLHIMVPSAIHNSTSTPKVEVLLDGLRLPRYDLDGSALGEFFTSNPAWLLLDIVQRIGWSRDDLDVSSFARCASICDEPVVATGAGGEAIVVARSRCNLVLRTRRSAAEVIRGIKNTSGLYLKYAPDGRLQLGIEHSLEKQQPSKPDASNSTSMLNGGWPSYEFGDGTYGFSGIARKANGEPSIRFWGRSTADTPNRMGVEFQDEFNLYQRDSLSLTDIDDVVAAGGEIAATPATIGIPNFSQAARVLGLQLNRSVHGNLFVEFDTSVKGVGLSPGDIITVTYQREALDRTPFRILTIALGLNCSTLRITAQLHDDSWYSDESLSVTTSNNPPRQGVHVPRPVLGTYVDFNGISQYGITQTGITESDGGGSVLLTVRFNAPPRSSGAFSGLPKLSPRPQVFSDGGTMAGGQTMYYGITCVDSDGSEGLLSYVAAATLGSVGSAYRVVLTDLSFPPEAVLFNAYRGLDPLQFMRIATNTALASTFEDTGLPVQLVPPPDEYYDHTNTYWRYEVQPPIAGDIWASKSAGSTTLSMPVNAYTGKIVRITSGKGQGQERTVTSNTGTTLSLDTPWVVLPDSTSWFEVAEQTWQFGGTALNSPAQFVIPNRQGTTVEIVAKSANASDQESNYNTSPVTRWYVNGETGNTTDASAPPIPLFAIALGRQGTVDLVGVSFSDLTNTRDISSGTLTLHYWNELASPTLFSIVSDVSSSSLTVDLSAAGSAQPGDLIQVGSEILQVTIVQSGGTSYAVNRGQLGSAAQLLTAGSRVYHLSRKTFIVPFPRDFFGSPASGDYSHSQFLPDVRVAAAELFVTNQWGSSAVRQQAYTAFTDNGLRTFSGGQFSIQVDGYLAAETSVAPPLVIEDSHCARDIFAIVAEAPSGGDIEMEVKQNGALYCSLTIAAGATTSNVVNGFGLPPLGTESILTLDLVSVPSGSSAAPGRDLTVTIRL